MPKTEEECREPKRHCYKVFTEDLILDKYYYSAEPIETGETITLTKSGYGYRAGWTYIVSSILYRINSRPQLTVRRQAA